MRCDQIPVVPDRHTREGLDMSEKNYLLISATIFALVALLHFVRILANWSVQVGTVTFPLWGSWLGLLIGAALSIWAFRLMSQWRTSHQ